MASDTIAFLRRENENLERELGDLEALRADKDELRRLQQEVDGYRSRPFGGHDAEAQEVFNAMQKEIVELRNRCDGYHAAFQEAQKKLSRLRDLYTEKVLPKLAEHQSSGGSPLLRKNSSASPQRPRANTGSSRPSQPPLLRKKKSLTTTPAPRKIKHSLTQ
eukprot:TRINITY_DN2922_c1_g1_i1.p1 TRINITY_DN2922_c1_g1~~TRINITY_DN2922_c1_g1_i1.p1  ORF type:complete len:162 (+),score=28.88 TRINITY_DN2922_c1_g1_i1:35-520(+)